VPSWEEEHLAGGFPRFKLTVRLGSFGERKGLVDSELQWSGG
jgi:hypothetical protein